MSVAGSIRLFSRHIRVATRHCRYAANMSSIPTSPAPLPRLSLDPDVESHIKKTYCNSQVVAAIGKEEAERKFHITIDRLSLPPGYTTVRVCTVNRTRDLIREELQQLLKKEYSNKAAPCPPVEPHPVLPDVLVIPTTGPHPNLQHHTKEIMVDIHCGAAILRGAHIFAPGVLGATADVQAGDQVSVYVDVEGKCLRGFQKPYSGPRVFVGNGVARMSRDDIFSVAQEQLSGIGVEMTSPLYGCPPLNDVMSDSIFLQNLPSTVAGHVLDPQPGERVLDMCAAPGGKTTHLATLMSNQGAVIALDKSQGKVDKVMANARRLGLTCIQAYMFDGGKAASEAAVCEKDETSLGDPPYPPNTFDRVLVDAPCSALGQRPALGNKMKLKTLKSYPSYQRRLFPAAVQVLKTGCTLVYSTCTLTLEENEGQVEWLLNTFPCLELVPQTPYLGGPGLSGTSLTQDQLQMLQRFEPWGDNRGENSHPSDRDTIGFFIAKFIKRAR
ncbi:tRNA (cytosine(72)-C(5))-methyltransferase NSUN6-like isoform X1 [Branchiostoma floridae]|uniref:tRNA (Cytosine(72)-C(5))-methyltransferase NSUN6-like isoform X1 n=1 Tax=Branchiostoma floridae TaxID=7739 RepID=A0A9J7LUI8_BRAFL|nr:tRNA (cytosine(72)-C(5))-methyltransferase NSUN6-like isoform X1 [Branchiostoma floridae]